MSRTRADSATQGTVTVGKPTQKLTEYRIFEIQTDGAWKFSRDEDATSAHAAIRNWADAEGEAYTGGRLMAVPTSRITELQVTVETRRQLTLGAP